ncbi:MAG: protein translocase subunit SecD [Spirochaetes bacterium]|nr:protein translocase subunit SecD [Spirochaetota bacterium]
MSDRKNLRIKKTFGTKEFLSDNVRIILTVLLFLFSCYLLYPTIKWYFILSAQDREYTMMTNEQLRELKVSDDTLNKIKENKKLKNRIINLGLDLQGGLYIILRPDLSRFDRQLSQAELSELIDKAMLILTNRIDQFGVAETHIRKIGNEGIEIEIPGAKDVERVQRILLEQGQLTFQLVDEATLATIGGISPADFDEFGQYKYPEKIPEDSAIYWLYEKDKYGVQVKKVPTILKKKVELDGTAIGQVLVQNGMRGIEVTFTLNPEGAEKFYKITADNKGRHLAIVLDGKIQSMPVINEPIPNGQVAISGNFTMEEAKDLENILKAGALSVPLVIAERQDVGPTLGRDSITKGIRAGLIGALIVGVIMVVAYLFSGLMAYIFILFNIFMLVAFLAAFNYTLTLPGIAGILLNVGMGVDAFIIIFEKIKEDYLKNLNRIQLINIVNDSFTIASATIVDANLTTLISAVALMFLGGGSIRGFGVTLTVGIIINMFIVLITGRWYYINMFKKWKFKSLTKIGGIIR